MSMSHQHPGKFSDFRAKRLEKAASISVLKRWGMGSVLVEYTLLPKTGVNNELVVCLTRLPPFLIIFLGSLT
jgi:hypothetical protein